MSKISFKIITPERIVFDAEADSVTCPTQTGQITVLPNHIPLISALANGELVVRTGKTMNRVAIAGGFLEVRPGNKLVVLADSAQRAEEIDIAEVESARKKAHDLLKNRETLSKEEYAVVVSEIEKNNAMILVANRHRGHHGGVSKGLMDE